MATHRRLPLLLATLAAALAPRPALGMPCNTNEFPGKVSGAATAILGDHAYLFPGSKCHMSHEVAPCHYKCDITGDNGWETVTGNASALGWEGLPANVVGVLADGTEAIFLVGGHGKQDEPVPYMAMFTEADGMRRLPDAPHTLALATASYVEPIMYLIGGVGPRGANSAVHRFNTYTMKWISDARVSGSYTPRRGLSSVVLGGAILIVGGHTFAPDSSFTGIVEILDLGRPGTDPEEAEMRWYKGPSMNQPRAYSAAFTLGCRVYVAGGATDDPDPTHKDAMDLRNVEVYSVPAGQTMDKGAWTRTVDLPKAVSHVEAIVPHVDDASLETALMVGGLYNRAPSNLLQEINQACNEPRYNTKGAASGSDAPPSPPPCDTSTCGWGYVDSASATGGVQEAANCIPCPGTDTSTGSCAGSCGGVFHETGTCSVQSALAAQQAKAKAATAKNNQKLLGGLLLLSADGEEEAADPTAVCKCVKDHFGGEDCQSCVSHRDGPDCLKCEKGHWGEDCQACPGLGSPKGICGGHGKCEGDGSTRSQYEDGTCSCDYGWNPDRNCTACNTQFWGPVCEMCTCQAIQNNATARDECPPTAACNGHGKCTTSGQSQCKCDAGWSGDYCSIQGGGGLGAGTWVLIVCAVLGGIGGVFLWQKNIRDARKNTADDDGTAQIPPAVYQPPKTPPASESSRLLNDVVAGPSYGDSSLSFASASSADATDNLFASLMANADASVGGSGDVRGSARGSLNSVEADEHVTF